MHTCSIVSCLKTFLVICPSADEPPAAAFLMDNGWPVGAGLLADAAKCLQSQDIESDQDFIGLCGIDELPGAVLRAQFLADLGQGEWYTCLRFSKSWRQTSSVNLCPPETSAIRNRMLPWHAFGKFSQTSAAKHRIRACQLAEVGDSS